MLLPSRAQDHAREGLAHLKDQRDSLACLERKSAMALVAPSVAMPCGREEFRRSLDNYQTLTSYAAKTRMKLATSYFNGACVLRDHQDMIESNSDVLDDIYPDMSRKDLDRLSDKFGTAASIYYARGLSLYEETQEHSPGDREYWVMRHAGKVAKRHLRRSSLSDNPGHEAKKDPYDVFGEQTLRIGGAFSRMADLERLLAQNACDRVSLIDNSLYAALPEEREALSENRKILMLTARSCTQRISHHLTIAADGFEKALTLLY